MSKEPEGQNDGRLCHGHQVCDGGCRKEKNRGTKFSRKDGGEAIQEGILKTSTGYGHGVLRISMVVLSLGVQNRVGRLLRVAVDRGPTLDLRFKIL
jgi:hypothetical protein